jgi:hypothetical protein
MSWATLSATADRVALGHLGSVPVTAGASSGRGFLLQNSELVLQGQLELVDYVLSVPASAFGWLGYGDLVVVGGREFRTIHRGLRTGDGTWVQVPLQPAERSALPVPPMAGELILDGNADGDYDILDGNTDG